MTSSRLQRYWLAESIRLTEHKNGPLDDAAALRQVHTASGTLQDKILLRAQLLAQCDGLKEAQQHWLQGAKLAGLALLLLALLLGVTLAFGALGESVRPVNILWAAGALLGLHLLSLLLWLLSLLFPGDPGSIIGRLWLWMSDKLSRTGRSVQLVPALMVLLNRHKATRWGLAALLHGFWSVTLLSALVLLLLLLSTQHYQFLWQTTLLSSDTFITLIHFLSLLPELLGFSQPSLSTIEASANQLIPHQLINSTSVDYQWANWLIALVVTYGVVPRVLLLLLSLLRWQWCLRQLQLDMTLVDNQLLAQRLQPASKQQGITDPAPERHNLSGVSYSPLPASGRLLVAIELAEDLPWPPELPETIHDGGLLNDRQQRKALLQQLATRPAERLLIACDTRRSPDRGILRLISELASQSAACRIWLLALHQCDSQRLSSWRAALQQLQLSEAELTWLEAHDE
ncbi:MAG: DUF2868 domain-containing protein [Enterobacteriaceae bacterium]